MDYVVVDNEFKLINKVVCVVKLINKVVGVAYELYGFCITMYLQSR